MALRELILVSKPTIGLTLSIDGQAYRYVGPGQHTKLDGTVMDMNAWETECRTCGDSFTALADQRMTYMTRRCKPCRPTSTRQTPPTQR